MFGIYLPENIDFDVPPPHSDPQHSDYDPALNLMKLLAQYPAQRQQILKDWRAILPNDEWVDRAIKASPTK